MSLVRVILTYTNPSKLDFLKLSNVIQTGVSLSEQQIFIAKPKTTLLHYSNTRVENLKLTHALSVYDITPEYLDQFRLDFSQIRNLKIN